MKNQKLLAVVAAAHRGNGVLSTRTMTLFDLAVLHAWHRAGYIAFTPLAWQLRQSLGGTHMVTSMSAPALADAGAGAARCPDAAGADVGLKSLQRA